MCQLCANCDQLVDELEQICDHVPPSDNHILRKVGQIRDLISSSSLSEEGDRVSKLRNILLLAIDNHTDLGVLPEEEIKVEDDDCFDPGVDPLGEVDHYFDKDDNPDNFYTLNVGENNKHDDLCGLFSKYDDEDDDSTLIKDDGQLKNQIPRKRKRDDSPPPSSPEIPTKLRMRTNPEPRTYSRKKPVKNTHRPTKWALLPSKVDLKTICISLSTKRVPSLQKSVQNCKNPPDLLLFGYDDENGSGNDDDISDHHDFNVDQVFKDEDGSDQEATGSGVEDDSDFCITPEERGNGRGLNPQKNVNDPERPRILLDEASLRAAEFDAIPSGLEIGIIRPHSYKCTICGKSFAADFTFDAHMERGHPFACPLAPKCPSKFDTMGALDSHLKSAHPDVPGYKCAYCDKLFQHACNLAVHMVMLHETGEKKFACEKCPKAFALEENFQRHVELHKIERFKPMVCDVCDSRFENEARLERHVATHNKKRYVCVTCGFGCPKKVDLDRHIGYRHTREKIAQCPHCEESFIDRALLRSHVARVHTKKSHVCPTCGKSFGRVETFRAHLQRHDESKRLACDTCGEKFVYRNQLKAHLIKEHGADPDDPFVCEECGKTLTTANSLKLHVMKHRDEKPHKCDTCDYRAVSKGVLLRHIMTHTGERPFPCAQCEDAFKTRNELNNHTTRVHMPPSANEEIVRYPCPHCGKEYFKKFTLLKHMRRHVGEKPVKCDHCDESFSDKYAFSRHVAVGHTETRQDSQGNREHVCLICDKTFRVFASFQNHLRVHDESKWLVCDTCGEKFVHHHQLQTHQIKQHGADAWVCDQCGTKLTTAGGFKRHMMTHRGEKPYKCDICGNPFLTKLELRRHTRTHTDERPFPCPHCEYASKTRDRLNDHVRSMHTTGYVPRVRHSCGDCGKGFTKKSDLHAHLRQVHTGERPFPCGQEGCGKAFAHGRYLTQHLRDTHKIGREGKQ